MSQLVRQISKGPLLSFSAFSHQNTYNSYLQNFTQYDKFIINPSGKNDLIVNKDLKNLLKSDTDNNETIGQSAEKALCSIFGINDYIDDSRINNTIVKKIQNEWKAYDNIKQCPFKLVESLGYKNGAVDFTVIQNKEKKTLSVKTLKSKSGKICPQTIGQPTYKKWDQYFDLNENITDVDRFEFIKKNINLILDDYLKHTFCCDFLLLISNCYNKPKIDLLNKPTIKFKELDYEISFSREYDINKPNFSSTVKIYYDNNWYSIGEFQFHRKKEDGSGRDNLKFRFFYNFLKTMNRLKS